jgi:hypothetical protein
MAPRKPPAHPGHPGVQRPYQVPPDATAPKPGPPKPVPLPVYRDPKNRRA